MPFFSFLYVCPVKQKQKKNLTVFKLGISNITSSSVSFPRVGSEGLDRETRLAETDVAN